MPHLTIEYTPELACMGTPAALLAFNKVLHASGQFEAFDVKSRATALQVSQVGIDSSARAFAHAKLALLSGRDAETKRALAQALLAAMQELYPSGDGQTQLSVEIVDIDRVSYSKAVV